MTRGALEYMLQLSAVQLKAACKVVDNTCTFLLGNHLNLFSCPTIFTNAMSFKVLDQLKKSYSYLKMC